MGIVSDLWKKLEVNPADVYAYTAGAIGERLSTQDQRMATLLSTTTSDMVASGEEAKQIFGKETEVYRANFQKLLPYTGGPLGLQDPKSVTYLASLPPETIDEYIDEFEELKRQRLPEDPPISVYEGFGIDKPDILPQDFNFGPEWVDMAIMDIQGKPNLTPMPDDPQENKSFIDDLRFMLGNRLAMLGGDTATVEQEARRQTKEILGYLPEDYELSALEGRGVSPIRIRGGPLTRTERIEQYNLQRDYDLNIFNDEYLAQLVGEARGWRNRLVSQNNDGVWVPDSQNGTHVDLTHTILGQSGRFTRDTPLREIVHLLNLAQAASREEGWIPNVPTSSIKPMTAIDFGRASAFLATALDPWLDAEFNYDADSAAFAYSFPGAYRTIMASDIQSPLLTWQQTQLLEGYNYVQLNEYMTSKMVPELVLRSLLEQAMLPDSPWLSGRTNIDPLKTLIAELTAGTGTITQDKILPPKAGPNKEPRLITSSGLALLTQWAKEGLTGGYSLLFDRSGNNVPSLDQLLDQHTQNLGISREVDKTIYTPTVRLFDELPGSIQKAARAAATTAVMAYRGQHGPALNDLSPENQLAVLQSVKLRTVEELVESNGFKLGLHDPHIRIDNGDPSLVPPALVDPLDVAGGEVLQVEPKLTADEFVSLFAATPGIYNAFNNLIELGNQNTSVVVEWYKENIEKGRRAEELANLPLAMTFAKFILDRQQGNIPFKLDENTWTDILGDVADTVNVNDVSKITSDFRIEMRLLYKAIEALNLSIERSPDLSVVPAAANRTMKEGPQTTLVPIEDISNQPLNVRLGLALPEVGGSAPPEAASAPLVDVEGEFILLPEPPPIIREPSDQGEDDRDSSGFVSAQELDAIEVDKRISGELPLLPNEEVTAENIEPAVKQYLDDNLEIPLHILREEEFLNPDLQRPPEQVNAEWRMWADHNYPERGSEPVPYFIALLGRYRKESTLAVKGWEDRRRAIKFIRDKTNYETVSLVTLLNNLPELVKFARKTQKTLADEMTYPVNSSEVSMSIMLEEMKRILRTDSGVSLHALSWMRRQSPIGEVSSERQAVIDNFLRNFYATEIEPILGSRRTTGLGGYSR